MDKKTLVKYLKSLGIEVHTTTKARGHQGFFCNNRIDISKNTPEHRVIPTLLHEFAHFVHSKIEPDMMKTGGTFQKLFQTDNPIIEERGFSQEVALKSGETLVLSGYERVETASQKEGLGAINNNILGGSQKVDKTRTIVVILLTPVVLESPLLPESRMKY